MVGGDITSREVDAARAMLKELEIPDDPEFIAHAATMCKALNLLWVKRGYGQSWRSHGYLGSVLKIGMKSTRLMNLLWWQHAPDVPDTIGDDAEDTFLDLINYGVFGWQQFRAGEERGPVATREV